MAWVLALTVGVQGAMASWSGPGIRPGLNEMQNQIGNQGFKTNGPEGAIIDLINLVLPYVGIGAVVAFVFAGSLLVFGSALDSSIQRAKKIAIWAIVGIIVIGTALPLARFILELT
jgi:hypothetical protein